MQIALARYEISQDQMKWRAPPKKNKVIAMVAKEKVVKKAKEAEEESPTNEASRGRDAWKRDPTENNEKTQIKKGKTYNRCKWHEMWVTHDPNLALYNTIERRKSQLTSSMTKTMLNPRANPRA
jgi:hypothetical protein